MTEEYARIARSQLAQRAVHKVVTMLGDGDRVLAHCFAGKDRTGFTIAMVLEAAGVDRDAIMADYLASNAAVPELRASIVETIRRRMAETPEVAEVAEARLTDSVLGVQEAYLDAARARSSRISARSPATSTPRVSRATTSRSCAPHCSADRWLCVLERFADLLRDAAVLVLHQCVTRRPSTSATGHSMISTAASAPSAP